MGRNKVPAQRANTGGLVLPEKEKQRIESLVNTGQLGQARKVAERLCRKYRENPEAWFLLGAVCGSQGDYTHAVKCCQRTTQLAPQVAIGHFNLGVALNKAGYTRKAVAPLRKALELQPALPVACQELGSVYVVLGENDQALEMFSRLVKLQPDDTLTWIALGNLYEKQANLSEAERCYCKPLESAPHFLAARINLGNVLKLQGKTNEAEKCYQAILEKVPDNTDAIYSFGVFYQSLCRYAEAETQYRKLLDFKPTDKSSLNNLGLVLMAQHHLDEAVKVFTRLLKAQPGDVDARRNLATVFREQNRFDLAEEQLNTILSTDPDNIPTRQDLSLVWLQQGFFEKGWNEYEWRNAGIDIAERWPFPILKEMSLSEATVLVYPEQGIGDEIMFASCLRDLLGKTSRVILACHERLETIFQRSFPTASVIGCKQEEDVARLDRLPHIDAQISIASLPKYFRHKIEDFPVRDRGYLVVNPAAQIKWQSRYDALGDGLKVGVSWRGGHVSNTQMKRSIPLELWGDVLRLPNVHFVNLQYGDCVAELNDVQKQFSIKIHDWSDSDPLVDMDDFSAKVNALDMVISIDNSTVHLAGALGVRTWILQPFSPDWRWIPEQKSSYWYPTMRQYRQTVSGQWDDVLCRVADALACFRSSKHD
jgi:tetratricopeptide (TPR) repeat protein